MHSLANTGVHPVYVAVNPKTNTTYIANQGSNTVSVINCNGFSGKTDLAVNTINVGGFPDAVAVNPNTNMVYVTNDN